MSVGLEPRNSSLRLTLEVGRFGHAHGRADLFEVALREMLEAVIVRHRQQRVASSGPRLRPPDDEGGHAVCAPDPLLGVVAPHLEMVAERAEGEVVVELLLGDDLGVGARDVPLGLRDDLAVTGGRQVEVLVVRRADFSRGEEQLDLIDQKLYET